MSNQTLNKDDLSFYGPSLPTVLAAGDTTVGNTDQKTSKSGDAWSITNSHPETSQAFIFNNKSGQLVLSTAGMAGVLQNRAIEPS
jgi:hypothetical protein